MNLFLNNKFYKLLFTFSVIISLDGNHQDHFLDVAVCYILFLRCCCMLHFIS